MKKGAILYGLACFTLGAAIGGGGIAYASGVIAEKSTLPFFLNGSPVEVEAYLINENNYMKLRDIAALVDFGVTWDPATSSVHIDTTTGYTPEGQASAQPVQTPTPSPATVDHSAGANPRIFQGSLTRDLYNAIRDTVTNKEAVINGSYQPYSIDSLPDVREAMDTVTAAMGSAPVYKPVSTEQGKVACTATYTPAYDDAIAHTQGFIDGLKGVDEEEKVKAIAWYVCDRLTYTPRAYSAARILASDEVSSGSCMSYAYSFQFLCGRAGIPCIFQHSETHQWNKVYVNGRWWDVDVGGMDVGDDISHRSYSRVLYDPSEMQGVNYINAAPEVTRFAMEVLVPGSTK